MVDAISYPASVLPSWDQKDTVPPNGFQNDFERLVATKAVSQGEPQDRGRIGPSPVPPQVADAIRRIAGPEIAAAAAPFYVLPSWSDAGRIDPPLSPDAARQLGMATEAGLAFSVDGVDYAAVSEVDVRRNAGRIGVPYDEALSYFTAQEIVQAKFATLQDGSLTTQAARQSEVLGEAVSAAVVPDGSFMPLGIALSWLPQPREALPAGYDAFLAIAVQSLDDSLRAARIQPEGNVSPVQRLGDAYVEAAREADGKGSIRDHFLTALAEFSDAPAALLDQMAANYAEALAAAVK